VRHYAKPLESTSNITRQHYDLDTQQLQQHQTRGGDLEVLSETPRIYLVKAGAAVQRQQPRPGSRGPRRNFRRSGRSSQIQISPLHHDTTQPPSPPPRVINTRRDPSTTRYTQRVQHHTSFIRCLPPILRVNRPCNRKPDKLWRTTQQHPWRRSPPPPRSQRVAQTPQLSLLSLRRSLLRGMPSSRPRELLKVRELSRTYRGAC
jgi:hypothetical protein